jgi:hypothetical protein
LTLSSGNCAKTLFIRMPMFVVAVVASAFLSRLIVKSRDTGSSCENLVNTGLLTMLDTFTRPVHVSRVQGGRQPQLCSGPHVQAPLCLRSLLHDISARYIGCRSSSCRCRTCARTTIDRTSVLPDNSPQGHHVRREVCSVAPVSATSSVCGRLVLILQQDSCF